MTHLPRRLLRLEPDQPRCAGAHRAVMGRFERQAATAQTSQYVCGQETCVVHPALTIVFKRERNA